MATPTLAEAEQLLLNPRVQKFLDYVSWAEGTEKHGYRTEFGGGKLESLDKHPRKLHDFTKTDGTKDKTSAFGRYQILTTPWDEGLRFYGLEDKADPHTQDLVGVYLIGRQKGAMDAVLEGDYDTAVRKLAPTWASFPSSKYKQRTRSWEDTRAFFDTAPEPPKHLPPGLRKQIAEAAGEQEMQPDADGNMVPVVDLPSVAVSPEPRDTYDVLLEAAMRADGLRARDKVVADFLGIETPPNAEGLDPAFDREIDRIIAGL